MNIYKAAAKGFGATSGVLFNRAEEAHYLIAK